MVRRINHNHYIASPLEERESPIPIHHRQGDNRSRSALGLSNRGYSTDGEESLHRGAPSERTISEYTITNERIVTRSQSPPVVPARKHKLNGRRSRSAGDGRTPSALSYSHNSYGDNGSDIYVTSAAYKAPSEISRGSRYSRHSRAAPASHYSYRSAPGGGRAPSVASTVKTRTSRKGGVTVETMAAPNPFCPNIKGMCCLMLLINLGLILVCLGLVIVIQFFDFTIWGLGILFLIFGIITLIGSIAYAVVLCRESRPLFKNPQDLYWTHHWQKNIGSPEIHYKAEEKYADPDRYSDRYSVGKMSNKYSDRGSPHRPQRY